MEDLLELSLAKDKFQYSQSSILHDPSSTLIPIIIFSPLRILVAEPARKAPISHTQPHTQLPFVPVIPVKPFPPAATYPPDSPQRLLLTQNETNCTCAPEELNLQLH